MSDAQAWADRMQATAGASADTIAAKYDRLGIMQQVRILGGGMIMILLIAVVLNEVFSAVNVGSGPFSEIGTDLESTGVAAVGLLVVGLIVIAANALMGGFTDF